MGLRKSLARWLLKGANIGGLSVSSMQEGRPYRPGLGIDKLIERYTSWVYMCVDENASSCARIPLRLYVSKPKRIQKKPIFPTRRIESVTKDFLNKKPHLFKFLSAGQEVEEVVDHPLLDTLKSVNMFMNRFDLISLLFQSLEITGDAYWLKVRNGDGIPTEIWPLFPQHVSIIPDKNNFIKGFEYKPVKNEPGIVFAPKDIVHNKYWSIKNSLYGMAPLEAAAMAADTSLEMGNYEYALLKNGGNPDVAIIYPENVSITPDEKKRMEKEYRKKYSGTSNQGKMTILTGGADLKQIGLAPKEMSYLQGKKWTLQEICAVFGVPISYIVIDQVSRANAESADYVYMRNTIAPKLIMVEEKLNEQLTPDYDENLFLAFDNPVPKDKEYRLKQIDTRLKNKVTTINEERAIEGFDPVEWGDEPVQPAPMPFGQLSIKTKSRELPSLEVPASNIIPETLAEQLRNIIIEQGKEILQQATDEALRYAQEAQQRYSSVTVNKAGADDLVAAWFDFAKWNEKYSEILLPYYKTVISDIGLRALKKFGMTEFNGTEPHVLNALGKHNGTIKNISVTQQKEVRRAITAGIDAGDNISDIRKRITSVYGDDANKFRASRIARTESIWAFNEGAVQGYIQSGVVSGKKWSVAHDDRLCPICEPMDGVIVDIEGSFVEKGGEWQGMVMDYEAIEHPPLHPMCRCSLIPIVVD